ncbi:hypothetical protein SH528x_003454 [Novipirellula sp. SH528]|uniref:hypothetical protein n=1 Tax=Novipirellula sp. SH528 TaxID=3454466 RepID=UPI003F9F2FFD
MDSSLSVPRDVRRYASKGADVISLGLVSGPDSSVLETRCRVFLREFERERKTVNDVFLLNIVFHSPLSLKKPDFTGFTTGAFSRTKQTLLIAIAVPDSVPTFSLERVNEYIVTQLHDAVDFGASDLAKRSVAFNPAVYHAFIDHVVEKLPT